MGNIITLHKKLDKGGKYYAGLDMRVFELRPGGTVEPVDGVVYHGDYFSVNDKHGFGEFIVYSIEDALAILAGKYEVKNG